MDFNTYDCGYIGGWSIADNEEKEKIIDALNSIQEKYLISSEEAHCAAKDYEPIQLYRKHRLNWCPRLEK